MDPQELQEFENLALTALSSLDATVRANAENAISSFGTQREHVPKCQFILQNSENMYAHMIATQGLMKLISANWNNFTANERFEIRDFAISYLGTTGLHAEKFVVANMVQLVGRITKLGWTEDEKHRMITQEAARFLDASYDHMVIGLELLGTTVNEINTALTDWSLIQHRKVATSFRDTTLLGIFQTALNTLQQLSRAQINSEEEANNSQKVADAALGTILACLSFDFIGTSPEEATEEQAAPIQIPATWKHIIEDRNTLQLLSNLYQTGCGTAAELKILETFGYLASVRRSLFAQDIKCTQYVDWHLKAMNVIMSTRKGLDDPQMYHEFCRWMGRLKANFQLDDYVKCEAYAEWIELVAHFTVEALNSYMMAPNSVAFVVGMWCRLCQSGPQNSSGHPTRLENYADEIVRTYIMSRLQSVKDSYDNDADDPFENVEDIKNEMQVFHGLGRYHYEFTTNLVISLVDPMMQEYQNHANLVFQNDDFNPDDNNDLFILEDQLTWLVYVIAGLISGRHQNSVKEEYDVLDGQLASRVFNIMQILDRLLQKHGNESLDLAILTFFDKFRRSHIGEQGLSRTKAYEPMTELIGLNDPVQVLDAMIVKIGTNLTYWHTSDIILTATLNLFRDLATATFSSQKLLIKLDAIKFLIANHTTSVGLLENPANFIHRSTFYLVVGSLLFMDENFHLFEEFVQPFERIFADLNALPHPDAFRTDDVKGAVVALLCDLRGLCSATNTSKQYVKFFEWIFPQFTQVLIRVAEVYYDTPQIASVLLQFWDEFVKNKSSRIQFHIASANGILLFIETSKLAVAYGSRLLTYQPAPARDLYDEKYSLIELLLTMMCTALNGSYCCFGVFALYNDPSLAQALDVAIQLVLSIPIHDMMGYPPLARVYFTFLEILFHNHIEMMLQLDTQVFLHILSTLVEALSSFDRHIFQTTCCSIDHITAFQYNSLTKDSPAARDLQKHLNEAPDIFPRVLQTLFTLYLFEDSSSLPQWVVCKPFLNLILLYEKEFEQLKMQVANNQSRDRRDKVVAAFAKITENIGQNLNPRNREQFSHNLNAFRAVVKQYIEY